MIFPSRDYFCMVMSCICPHISIGDILTDTYFEVVISIIQQVLVDVSDARHRHGRVKAFQLQNVNLNQHLNLPPIDELQY